MTTDDVKNGGGEGEQYTAEALESEIVSIERERAKRRPQNWTYGPSLRSWLGDDEPDADDSGDWCMRGLVPRNVPFVIGGDPKTGKTMLAESWAIALAMGVVDWCGYAVGRRFRVLIMPREDAERTTKIRIWQLARGMGLRSPHELEGFLSVDPHNPLDMGNAEHTKRLEAACDRFDVVIIDSFATSHHGDENSSRDMAEVMGVVRDISLGTDTAMGFIHHFNGKGAADDKRSPIHRLRGSSAIAGYARHVVGVERGKDKGQVVIAADGNFEFKPDPFVVQLMNGQDSHGKRTLRYELVGDANDARRASEDRIIDEAIMSVVNSDGITERALRSLVIEELKSSGAMPKGVRVARISMRASALKSEGRIEREVGGEKLWRTT